MTLGVEQSRVVHAPADAADVRTEAPRDYVIITGHGRSGTNWLLSLLDFSPRTHCRCNPYLDGDAPLAQLPGRFIAGAGTDGLDAGWDRAMAWTARRLGASDQRIPVTKRHYFRWSQALGLHRALHHGKVRRLLGLLMPGLRREEWRPPWWLGSSAGLAEALPVLRTSQVPGWVCWALGQRPAARILHIVRHPGGFLNSWRNRFLRDMVPEQVHAANLARLHTVAAADDAWARRWGDIDGMSLEESELWYWRYASEVIHAAGAGRTAYRRVIYERLAADPVGEVRGIYAACGLDWSAGIEAGIQRSAGAAQEIADAWRKKLSAEQVALVERVLDGSPMAGWWDRTDQV